MKKKGFTDEKIEVTESFKFEKKRGLRTSDVIETAWSNAKQTWFRTVLNFIICFVGLTLFFVANVIGRVDAPSRLVANLYDQNILDGTIQRKNEDKYHPSPMLTIDEVNTIRENNPALKFYSINYHYRGVFGASASEGAKGVTEISQNEMQAQKYIYGESPKALNGFFVTENYAREVLLPYAKVYPTSTGNREVTDIEDLIGFKASIGLNHDLLLCGIVENSDLNDYYIYFNDGFFNSIADLYEKDHLEGYCDYLYFTMSGDFKSDYKFFKEYHGENIAYGDTLDYATDSIYFIRTALSGEFYGQMAGYLELSDWFFGLGLVLMAFDVLLCFNIISSTIRKNEKENGILRALGFSNFDLFKIYMLQMAFPYFLLIPLVGVAGRIIIDKLNENLITLSLFAIGVPNVLWLLLLCAGIVVISTLLAMIKLFRKQPINAIRTN